MNAHERLAAYQHLTARFPFMTHLIVATGKVPLPAATKTPVATSLVRIVVGQMLSRSAAQTILKRMVIAAEHSGVEQLYHLTNKDLRTCGLSDRKARTVAGIRDLAENEYQRLESWRELGWHNLRQEVSSVWGLSDWSAGMLAIFDFALPDVFPLGDGSLVRAMRLIEQLHMSEGELFPHELGSPYGSYLAMTLWAALDNSHLPERSAAKQV